MDDGAKVSVEDADDESDSPEFPMELLSGCTDDLFKELIWWRNIDFCGLCTLFGGAVPRVFVFLRF